MATHATLPLADDSTTIQRVIELTFTDEDVRVIVVGTGDAAIQRVEQQPPDIVLADVGLSGKNGYEVARYIKHAAHLSHIPVLLLTGAFEPVDWHKANEAGCDGVLTKPFEPRLVIGRVKELLERSRDISAKDLAGPFRVAASAPGQPAPSAPAQADAAQAAPESFGDFFDKLDAAFANLPARREVPGTADWNNPLPSASDGLPSFLAPPLDVGRLPSSVPVGPPASAEPARPATDPLPEVRSPSAADQVMPPLAEAFAALLAAEQSGEAPANAVKWARPPLVTDDLVERVAQRVLERLSDRVMRETTAAVVSSIAERLVREELDRIKAAIKNL
jgi:DNA-binding response OmpR family regulator